MFFCFFISIQTKLFTVYLMIFGDCDDNFLFISKYVSNAAFAHALQYTI